MASFIPDPLVLLSSGFLISATSIKVSEVVPGSVTSGGKARPLQPGGGCCRVPADSEFRAAGNAMAKQTSANQQQLARGGNGLGVGDSS